MFCYWCVELKDSDTVYDWGETYCTECYPKARAKLGVFGSGLTETHLRDVAYDCNYTEHVFHWDIPVACRCGGPAGHVKHVIHCRL